MTKAIDQLFFIPIYEVSGAVAVPMPDGSTVRVQPIIEGIHQDGDRMLESEALAMEGDGKMIVASVAGTLLRGRVIDFDDIVGWAIEHGYLETLDAPT